LSVTRQHINAHRDDLPEKDSENDNPDNGPDNRDNFADKVQVEVGDIIAADQIDNDGPEVFYIFRLERAALEILRESPLAEDSKDRTDEPDGEEDDQ